ncbi:MAG: hypothetical protein QW260_08295, partial [Thermoproteota archaeon]
APITAGIIAEINAVLAISNQSSMGFLNPIIYKLANIQFASLQQTADTGYLVTGSYNSSLPDLPFSDVIYGRNHIYNAKYAYDLVTGWGSINAYNLTVFVLNKNYSGYYSIAASAVKNVLSLNSMDVTSYYSNGIVNTNYNASIQQNFFLADGFGTPIYWVQNVIYIKGSNISGFNVNYTGWVVYPFENMTVYKYNFPSGKVIYLPKEFNITSWLNNLSLPPLFRTMNFEVNSQIISIPVPGAAYIIDSYNHSYVYNGNVYTNRYFPNDAVSYPGWLSPQFGLVGGPSSSTGHFENTTGTMHSYIEPMGYNQFIPTASSIITTNNDQTGEDAANLLWSYVDGAWIISTANGSSEQGVAYYYADRYYYVNFTETGLPANTLWSISFDGLTKSSSLQTISFVAPNGTYYYNLSTVSGYRTNTAPQTLAVDGGSLIIPVTFTSTSVLTYKVEFIESGLPSGNWYVNITGQQSSGPIPSSQLTYSIYLPNGSYSYSVSTGNNLYKPSPSSGSFTVNGVPVSMSISFSEVTYSVTFTESGLPSGTMWYVNLSNGQSFSSTTSTISFSETNGTYSYTIATTDKIYKPSPSSGSFTVNGANVNQAITFSLVTYTVTFTESGLSSGTMWYVNLSNGQSFSSTTSTLSFSETNGTYSYTIATTDKIYKPFPSSGLFTVNGANVNQAITFSLITYTVTFTESGLPSGTTWSVTFNGNTKSSTTNTISFTGIANGTYSYSVGVVSGYTANPSSGTIIVNGANVNQAITFSLVTYTVTFTESGLPSGTTWYVNITNGPTSGAITGSSYSFSLSNGTYSYTIATVNKIYSPSPSSGSFTVNGANVNQAITFSLVTYTVIFTESGLPSGSTWSVTLLGTAFNGQYINSTLESSTGTITFNEPNGSYTYTVHLPSGYTSSNAKGFVSVSGAPVSVTISAQTPTNYLLYIIILIVVIIAVLGVVIAIWRRGKKKQGPKQWQEPPKEQNEEKK